MNTTLRSPPAHASRAKNAATLPTAPGIPVEKSKATFRAPNWLQLFLIGALLGSAIFVGVQGRYLWCSLLAVADIAFGASFLLRRMVGDYYDRS